MPFDLVITSAGRAALVNAANTGTLPVTLTHIGVSATFTPPVPSLTALPAEIKRIAAISGDVVADDTIHVTLLDESADAYALRSIAIYLADGTIFACAGQANPLLTKTASSIAGAAFDITFADIDAASLAFGNTDFLLPPATTERLGLVELATVAEAQAGTDPVRALTPQSARMALLAWLLGLDGAGCGLDADLLDGQHGSFYSNIPARLGFNPLNAANYTPADVLAKLLGVDGSGSGIDADMLDGMHASQIVPAGVIVMWSGSVAAIPGGWALCNGSSGTPNLRDRFVVGAGGAYPPARTGGAAQHGHNVTVEGTTLTVEQVPAHDHAMFANVAVDTALTGATSVARATTSGPGESEYQLRSAGTTPATVGLTAKTGGGQAHGHGASVSEADHLPPYYALAFIMKL